MNVDTLEQRILRRDGSSSCTTGVGVAVTDRSLFKHFAGSHGRWKRVWLSSNGSRSDVIFRRGSKYETLICSFEVE